MTVAFLRCLQLCFRSDCNDEQVDLSHRWAHTSEATFLTLRIIFFQLALKEHPFVIWLDSSIRFTTGNLTLMFEMTLSSGMTLTKLSVTNIDRHTHPQMFETLNEPRCLYRKYSIYPAGALALFAKDYIIEGIMKPWVKCALVERCMQTTIPFESIKKCSSRNTVCHRYDQSALNILITRLFHRNMNRHLMFNCEFWFVWRARSRRSCTQKQINSSLEMRRRVISSLEASRS